MAEEDTEITTVGNDIALQTPDRAKGGMSLASLESMLSDIRFQPSWREEADRCDDFYDGHQLTGERLARMEKLGIPPLVTNLIAPVINSVLGMEAKSRTDWRVTTADEADQVPEELMLALNAKLNEAERESRADRAISGAYASQIKSGVGWVEVGRTVDCLSYPYRVATVHRNEIWWDWRAKQPDLTDARYLIRKRRFDKDELTAIMPEHADLIQWAVSDRFKTWQWELNAINNSTDLAYAAHLERVTNIDATEWRDADRGRATVFEVWYRQWQRGLVLELPDGRIVPYNEQDPQQAMAVKQGMVQPQQRVFSEVRVAFFLGCHRLYDLPTPYPHRFFPYVPFWGYEEGNSGVKYGMIRAMISPQDVVNSADAKMHWLLNARRLVADSNALDTKYNTWRQVQEQLSTPNAAVLLDPSKPGSRFKVESDFQLSAQQFQRRMQAANDIEGAAGVYKAMLGKEGAATSGIGINSLIEQSNVMMAEINDNASFARRQVGEMLFSLVLEDILGRQMAVAVKKQGKKSIVVLNCKQKDDTGQWVVENDVSQVRAKVVLTDLPSTASFKSQQLQVISEVAKSLPPAMQAMLVPAMVMLTDIPDKEEVADAIRKMAGVGQKLSDEEQAAADAQNAKVQQEVAALQQRTAEANVQLLEAKVAQLEKQNAKLDAEKLATMVEAMYAAMQAAGVVATVPHVAPIGDEILRSAADGTISVSDPQPEIKASPQDAPAGDMKPPSPFIGERHGIETAANDGTRFVGP